MDIIEKIRELTGRTLFDYQAEAVLAAEGADPEKLRMLLFYKPGAGKSLTALAAVMAAGYTSAVVIAPPSTHKDWEALGVQLGVEVEAMSHQKFRQKGTKLSRTKPIIGDEWHLFGGHRGMGWVKIDRLARSLQAPLIAASATPEYNDAERVYCIVHALDPHNHKGGFIEFIYRHCITEQNPFGMEPIVTALRNFSNAAEMLAALPYTYYVEDDVDYTIHERDLRVVAQPELDTYGYNPREHRMVASQMEEKHVRVNLGLISPVGGVWDHVYQELDYLVSQAPGPVLIYAAHSTVAEALAWDLKVNKVRFRLVTGKTTKKLKDDYIGEFKANRLDVLVGTASLATGTDGLDKVCDMLIILDDTEDNAHRRQLIGRIMPRGSDTDATMKQVYRLNL